MLNLFDWSSARIRLALLGLTVLQLAGCGSPEDRARTYYEHGMKLFSEHDNAKAAIELRNAVKLKKDLVGAWRTLARIDELNRNWGGVASSLQTVLELDPNDIAARLKLGKLQLLAGHPNEALSLVNSGIDSDDGNADLHALKATISFKLDDRAGAIREAQAAIALDPANADSLMILATDRLAHDDPKGALSFLSRAPIAEGTDLEKALGVFLLKIKVLEQVGDLQNKEALLRRLADLYPQEAGFQKLLVNFYVGQHRLEDAEKTIRALAAANPTDPVATLDVIRFLYTMKRDPAAARRELVAHISAGGEIFPYQVALAEMNFAEGNITDGKQLLEAVIRAGSSSEHIQTARITLAQALLGMKELDAAETLVNDILRDDRHNISALRLRASINLEHGRLDSAITDLLEALNYQPQSTELMSLLAMAYERNGLMELAEKQLSDATRASNFDVGLGLQYVEFLQRRGSIGRAEDVLSELNKRWPKNLRILTALAQVRLTRQNWSGAQEIAEAIRGIGSDGGIAEQIIGKALVSRNRYDDAIAVFQKAYSGSPTAASLESLVRVLLRANKSDQAVVVLKSALQKNSRDANALVLLGSIQLTGGSPDQALKSYMAAITAEPKNVIGYRALAEFYARQKHYVEAIRVIRTGIQGQPDMSDLHSVLANLLERSGDYDGAISEYESMLEKQPGNLVLTNNLASVLSDHRTDKASLDKARSLAASLRKSQIPQFKDTLGWVSYRQGDYRTAIPLFEEAAAALPDQASVHYHLGMGYISTGQLAKASEQLKIGLELAQDGDFAEKIRAALKKAGS